MKLENIGFYTLSDKRAMNVDFNSPLHRCELILTEDCNFKCPYCRKLDSRYSGTMTLQEAMELVDTWSERSLKNIRFSGGEPTMYAALDLLVAYAKSKGVKRIAISTNGSAILEYYQHLVSMGVNDISFSLDACCASVGDKMAGKKKVWNKVAENIRLVSRVCYTTVGIVFTKDTFDKIEKVITFAYSLGVSDIRIIPSAQFNEVRNIKVSRPILRKFPILKYRINNIKKGVSVRGIAKNDSNKCPLVLDDMAVLNKHHFPCIIYMREGGEPIGKLSRDVKTDRAAWYTKHDSHKDPICSKNCLDVCIAYNNKAPRIYLPF